MKKEGKEVPKEVGFITVISIIAGIIIGIFAIATLIMGLFLPSGLFLILTIFIFLPQKVLRFNKWIKLLIAVVGFFIVAMIVGFNFPNQEPEYVNYNLNEEFIITYNNINFSMIVYNATKEKTILVDGKERTTSGIFILVHGSVTNLGDIPTDLGFFSGLSDSQNNSYTALFFLMNEGEMQPNLKKDFSDIFEIPADATGLKFVVADSTNVVRSIELVGFAEDKI